MPQDILKRFPKANVFTGYSKTLDMTPVDYSVDWQIQPPWNEFSHVFTTRGCPNSCAYCAVKTLENDVWINPKWQESIDLSKPYIMISDNNLSAQPYDHIKEIVDFVNKHGKCVIFDNGFDCKLITPKLARLLAQLKFIRHGMRLSFDRIEEDGIFQKAVKTLIDAGIPKSQIMAFVFFNFDDKPKEAIYRAQECIRLGIRPYPQKFTPLNNKVKDNVFVGKHWTLGLARAFRYFYLMAGYYTKYDFLECIQSEKWQRRLKINKEDVHICLKD
ncbi:MAG: radical SAM protein [Theionarchaea archaeon]|nr:radical SAM protein [Theionarchaea archaeon]